MKKIKILYIIIPILILALLISSYFYLKNHNNTKKANTTTTSDIDKKVDLSPATSEDKKNNDANKEKIVARDEAIKSNTSANVVPIITYAGQYEKNIEVGGYVNLYEKDGTFTATFTQGNQHIKRSIAGNPNVQTTDCPKISINVSDFPSKGTWKLSLNYKSSTSSGDSEIKDIEVK